ncbi:thiamine-repressible mitochondrial transport protein THI74 [Sporodiniella umbellata]|nr:thiamine-repressible mitochondrial transport protein THI74 [Sporodiniella umbellata]
MSDIKEVSLRRYWGGILALAGVIFIWVSSSFAMNSLFGEMEYNKPFLVTYVNAATFSLYLIPFLLKQYRIKTQLKKNGNVKNYSAISPSTPHSLPNNDKLSTSETVQLSLMFCILWFFGNLATNTSLAYTTVGSSTILSSMSGLFTLGIGALAHVEKINTVKFMAVLVSFIGVLLISYLDHTNTSLPSASNPLLGDALALIGAVFYGCYTILLKYKIGNEERIDMSLFFGFVGAFNIVLLWPIIPLLSYLGLESFQLPTNATLWVVVFLNAFVGTFLSDYLWLLSMLMTSPLVVTLGISLMTPLALLGDTLLKGIVPSFQYFVSTSLVLFGFFVVNIYALNDAKEEGKDKILGDHQL